MARRVMLAMGMASISEDEIRDVHMIYLLEGEGNYGAR